MPYKVCPQRFPCNQMQLPVPSTPPPETPPPFQMLVVEEDEQVPGLFQPILSRLAPVQGCEYLSLAIQALRSVIVEKHKGSISIESAVGAGTTFILRLPLKEA